MYDQMKAKYTILTLEISGNQTTLELRKKASSMVAYGCHSKITNCHSIFIVYFSFLYIFLVLIDLIC